MEVNEEFSMTKTLNFLNKLKVTNTYNDTIKGVIQGQAIYIIQDKKKK